MTVTGRICDDALNSGFAGIAQQPWLRGKGISMKYSEARPGRVFVIRLEHGEILHETIETFARINDVKAATLIALGGADKGSRLVVGPEHGESPPFNPMCHILDDAHEIAGVGTLFPDEDGNPVLHMHIAAGRGESAVAGCVREGVKIWQVGEVILQEIVGTAALRRHDPGSGFQLLEP